METLNNIAGGMSVMDAYAGMTCKVDQEPTILDLYDPEFRAFLDSVLRDALNGNCNTACIREEVFGLFPLFCLEPVSSRYIYPSLAPYLNLCVHLQQQDIADIERPLKPPPEQRVFL